MNSFTRFYDFHFAQVNCVVAADLCAEAKVPSFPAMRLYRRGELVKEVTGGKDLKFMSEWVENTLGVYPAWLETARRAEVA